MLIELTTIGGRMLEECPNGRRRSVRLRTNASSKSKLPATEIFNRFKLGGREATTSFPLGTSGCLTYRKLCTRQCASANRAGESPRYSSRMRSDKYSNASRSFLVETLAKSNVQLKREVANLERELALARHLAYHDPLTGLPNRALLLDRLQQAILQAERQNKAIGLLLLDLDCFKHVNDRLGHNAGDLVLRVTAQRLASCIRAGDTASRYGGDEFVILLPDIRGNNDVVTVAQKITASMSIPHQVGDETILVSASLGSAVFDGGRASCDELIGAADSAMYRVKARSDGSVSVAGGLADVAA